MSTLNSRGVAYLKLQLHRLVKEKHIDATLSYHQVHDIIKKQKRNLMSCKINIFYSLAECVHVCSFLFSFGCLCGSKYSCMLADGRQVSLNSSWPVFFIFHFSFDYSVTNTSGQGFMPAEIAFSQLKSDFGKMSNILNAIYFKKAEC